MLFKNLRTKKYLDLVFDAGTIGIQLVVSTFIGLAAGYYLDRWLGTKPWLLLLFLILGIAAGFKNVYQEAKKLQSKDNKKGDSGRGTPES